MNIAMLSYHTCPLATLGGKDTGGMNVYVRDLTTHLGKLGVHVDVFTRSQDEHVPHILHDLGYGNRVVHIPAGPEVPCPKAELELYLSQFVEGILKFAKEKGIHYDLIHAHYWLSGLAGIELKEKWNVPLISMFHTLGHMKNQIAQSEDEVADQNRLDGEEAVLAGSDCIVISTPAEEGQILKLYQNHPSCIRTIPPGVDTSRFYPIPMDEARQVIGLTDQHCMLLFVGRIEPLKGLDTLLRAIAKMTRQGIMQQCPHYLTIIGGEPDAPTEKMNSEMARIQKLAVELGIADLMIFRGKQAQDTLPYYYSAAQIVIVPSHYESFGLVALEAMACGTPVVASQVGGLAYLVQDGVTGYFVADGDSDALAACLTTLIQDENLRCKIGSQARSAAQAYEWDKVSSQIVNLYYAVLKNQSS
jgi:D-inositol-3-phosphate glycosyltransferase